MSERHVRLKDILRAKHWQAYGRFCYEYDRAARTIDPSLVGSRPSRAQLHRWLAGDLKGLPYPDHCLVLERMLPGWTAQRLFEPCVTGCPAEGHDRAVSPATRLDQDRLRSLDQQLGISGDGLAELGKLAGNLVDVRLVIDLYIAEDSSCEVAYRYHLLNLTDRPIARLARDVWFEHSQGRLELVPLAGDGHSVTIDRMHSAANLTKFACEVSPPVLPDEPVRFGYLCLGGSFQGDYYWRQQIARHTSRFTLNVRHRNVGPLAGVAAIEELPDGAGSEQPVMSYSGGGDALMTLDLDRLRPGGYVTLRWATG